MRILISSIILVSYISIGYGQNIKFGSEQEYLKKTYGEDKKVLIENFLDLNAEEGSAFWPIYDKYETKRSQFGERRWKRLIEYNKEYQGINDAIADRWMDSIFHFNSVYLELLEGFTNEVKNAIGPLRALQVYEFEAYLQVGTRKYIIDHAAFVKAGYIKKK